MSEKAISLIYGEDKNEVPHSLLLDEYMQYFIMNYDSDSGKQVLQARYNITSPKFWYDYLAHAIEMHLLNQEQTSFSLSA